MTNDRRERNKRYYRKNIVRLQTYHRQKSREYYRSRRSYTLSYDYETHPAFLAWLSGKPYAPPTQQVSDPSSLPQIEDHRSVPGMQANISDQVPANSHICQDNRAPANS